MVPSTIVPPFRSTATASPLTILPGSTTAEGAKKIPECIRGVHMSSSFVCMMDNFFTGASLTSEFNSRTLSLCFGKFLATLTKPPLWKSQLMSSDREHVVSHQLFKHCSFKSDSPIVDRFAYFSVPPANAPSHHPPLRREPRTHKIPFR